MLVRGPGRWPDFGPFCRLSPNSENMQRLLILLIALALGLSACDQAGPEDPTAGFDRAPMLENYADQLIVPAFVRLRSQTEDLVAAGEAFTAAPDAAGLSALREQWLAAFEAYQYAAVYNFGPAENSLGSLVENIGTWPVDTERVNQYIQVGDSNLNNFDRDTRGFLGAEFLLYGDGLSDEAVVAAFANDPDRSAYLRAVLRDIFGVVGDVAQAWEGSYRDDFLESTGTSAGSSTSMLYNNFVLNYERLKNFKLGLPLGKRAGQTQAEPGLVEALYSGHSLEMIAAKLDAIERTYHGQALFIANPEDGAGFVEYLEAVTGGPELVQQTEAQLAAVKNRLANDFQDGDDLFRLIESGAPQVETLHTEVQKLTRFLKSDMSSLLGISITYDSGDGD